MKILYCIKCGSAFALRFETQHCACGDVKGKYIDQSNAEISGEGAIPIGFSNRSFHKAVEVYRATGAGVDFDAFVIKKDALTVKTRKT